MEFTLSSDQQALMDGLDPLLVKHAEPPQANRAQRHYYDHALDRALSDNGFLGIVREEGYSALEGALVVDAISKLPVTVETAATVLVAPHLLPADFLRPLVLISGPITRPQRFLPQARAALMEKDGDVLYFEIPEGSVEEVESIFAYPMGKFKELPDLSKATKLGPDAVPKLHQWWRVALAVEAGAAMTAATAFTVEYVKNRKLFNRTLGSFQAVQHRLAECHQYSRGIRYLGLKAAWSGDPLDAALAAAYAQKHIDKVRFDLHQFNGGMGVSNEHLLHYWTYRFTCLDSELGGPSANAAAAAKLAYAA